MRQKRKIKKRNRRGAKKQPPKDYHVERFGPLILERAGRFVGLRSEWSPKEHEEYIARVRANREPFRQEINEEIKELLKIIEKYNPLDLLAVVAVQNVFANPETYKETTHKGRESYVEYALSVALSVATPNLKSRATEPVTERFTELVAKIFNDVGWFFAMEQLEGDDKNKHDLRYLSLMRYLGIRGDSYQEHHLDLVSGLFSPHDRFFLEHYGFSCNDVLAWIQVVESQVVEAFFHEAAFMLKLKEMHELFKRFVDEEGEGAFASMKECMTAYDALPEVQIKKKEIEELHQDVERFIFEVRPNAELPQNFLDLVSAQFGDNSEFASFPKAPGWPTNDSLIHRRPIVLHDGKYYCFLPQALFRNLVTIFEGLIREKDNAYFETTYQKARSEYLIDGALRHFQKLLPSGKGFKSLYYETIINGKNERAETDALVLFDGHLFIIEGKAGSLTLPARRGALSRLKRDVAELIDAAYEQAARTRRFINEHERPRLEFQNGAEALVLDKEVDAKQVYLVNVTLENLGHLSTQLESLKSLNLIKGREWPWSVMLNDLRVISEIVEGPSEFLVYLERRIRANDYPQFGTSDELDFFMYYLRDGLYFEDDRLKGLDHFGPHGYTEDLDRWYDYQGGRVSSGEKPTLIIPDEFKALIRKIEETSQPGFSEVTTTLLGFDVETMKDILDRIVETKGLSDKDGRSHDFTMVFGHSDVGVTVSFSPNRTQGSIKSLVEYCALKMYQLKIERWIFMMVDAKDGVDSYNFKVLKKPWSHDMQMEEQLVSYRQRKLEQFLATGMKPGRNDSCPCNGGLKFKKCCGLAL